MELILLEKVQNLGNLGDVVNVKSGFGRNFLLPSGKATRATETNLAAFEEKRIELEKKAEDKLMASKARATDLEGVEIKMSLNSSDEGKLYGSVGAREIAEALTELGHPVQKPEVILPEGGAVRLVGEYDVILHLHADVNVSVHLVIEGES